MVYDPAQLLVQRILCFRRARVPRPEVRLCSLVKMTLHVAADVPSVRAALRGLTPILFEIAIFGWLVGDSLLCCI